MSSLSEADKARITTAAQREAVETVLSNFPETFIGDWICFDECPPLWREFLANRAMEPLIELGIVEPVTRHGRRWWKLIDRTAAKAWLRDNKEASK